MDDQEAEGVYATAANGLAETVKFRRSNGDKDFHERLNRMFVGGFCSICGAEIVYRKNHHRHFQNRHPLELQRLHEPEEAGGAMPMAGDAPIADDDERSVSSSAGRQHVSSSAVWNFFEELADGSGRCRLCGVERRRTDKGTSTFWRHLTKVHKVDRQSFQGTEIKEEPDDCVIDAEVNGGLQAGFPGHSRALDKPLTNTELIQAVSDARLRPIAADNVTSGSGDKWPVHGQLSSGCLRSNGNGNGGSAANTSGAPPAKLPKMLNASKSITERAKKLSRSANLLSNSSSSGSTTPLPSSPCSSSNSQQQQAAAGAAVNPLALESGGKKRKDYINWDEFFMGTALLAAKRSKDPSTQVGAVICNADNVIVAIGYNGMPVGCADDEMPWGKASNDPLATKYPYVCHAEMNAVLNKNSESIKGATIYTTMFPCNECAKLIIQSRIQRVVYLKDKPEKVEMIASKRLFTMTNTALQQFEPSRTQISLNFD